MYCGMAQIYNNTSAVESVRVYIVVYSVSIYAKGSHEVQ